MKEATVQSLWTSAETLKLNKNGYLKKSLDILEQLDLCKRL